MAKLNEIGHDQSFSKDESNIYMDEYGSDEKNAMLNALQRPSSLKFKSTERLKITRNTNKLTAYNTTFQTMGDRKT